MQICHIHTDHTIGQIGQTTRLLYHCSVPTIAIRE